MVALVLASLLIPIAASVLVLLAPRRWVAGLSQVAAGLACVSSLAVLALLAADGGGGFTVDLVNLAGIVVFGVTVDKLSALVGLGVMLVGFLVVVYSAGYLSAGNREHPEPEVRRRYYFFLLLFIGTMAGLVYASTLISLLVCFELTGVCSWGLIGYYDDQTARRAALKAIVTTQVAALGLYLATAVFFGLTGSFQLAGLAGLTDNAKVLILGGVLVAAWGKSAQLPFHFWLPDAMAAPTPISAYLHAASLVKVGVYVFARCLLAAGSVPRIIGTVGAVMAVATLLYGFVMYFPQKDLKRLLAYSTITQIAYIFLALSFSVLGSRLAFNGAVAHLLNHAFAKGLFFLVAGALGYATGTRLLPALKGIMRTMPLVGLCFVVAALAVTGVPPFNGFFSKFTILAGSFQAAGADPLFLTLLVIALLETVGSFAWLLWVCGATVPGEPSPAVASATRLAPQIQPVLGALAVLTLVSGYLAAVWLG
jgi:hydrogenase-4 component D